MSTSSVELMVTGIRIIIQILVDAHERHLTPEVKEEIQKWYDELEQVIGDGKKG